MSKANGVDAIVSRQDETLLRELTVQRQMNRNHKATRAAQSGMLTADDLFVKSVPRERYEKLIDLAIEALRGRLAC